MSAITIGGDLIHYEKLGRGRPVILVHGWIGSWRYWIPLMQSLHTSFSVYTLDLIGFGDSSKNDEHYSVEKQVDMLETFLEQLGIPKAAMIGHGLGSLVILQYALRNPDKVARMLLTSMPLFDPGNLDTRQKAGTREMLTANSDRYSLAPNMEDVLAANDATIANAGSESDKTIVSDSTSSGIYTPFHELPTISRPDAENIDRNALLRASEVRNKNSSNPSTGDIDRGELRRRALEEQNKRKNSNDLVKTFKGGKILNLLEKCFDKKEPEFEKLKVDVDKSDDKVLALSAQDFDAGVFLDDLRRATAPIIAVHGSEDPIFSISHDNKAKDDDEDEWNDICKYLTFGKEDVFVPFLFQGTRHFPMLEHDSFPRLAADFLTKPDIREIKLIDKWIRPHR